MPRFTSRPRSVFVACGALAITIFGVVQMVRSGGFQWFLVFWVLVGLGVICFALLDAFRGRPEPGRDAPGSRVPQPVPSRPVAVILSIAGAGILIFGAIQIADTANVAFLVFWLAFGVAIIAFNLWSAFKRSPD